MVGAITGESAWAPRAMPPLALPATAKALGDDVANQTILTYGSEGNTFMADLTAVTASEAAATSTQTGGSGSTSTPSSTTPSSTTPGSTAPSGNGTTDFTSTPGAVELPDSGWPTGRYWWTVVPVKIVDVPAPGTAPGPTDALEYHDTELPQDACSAGRVWSFSLRSAPVTASNGSKPYASGVTPGPRLLAASSPNPTFVKFPLVTWKPALGAESYEIQVSKHLYPWRIVDDTTSVVTSVVLPLSAKNRGTWYYRVRGINPDLPAHAQKMTWSTPVKVKIVGDLVSIAG